LRLSQQSLNTNSIRYHLLADDVDFGVFYRVGNHDALTIMELGQQSLTLLAAVEQAPVDFMCPRQNIPLSYLNKQPQSVFPQ
ncbi:LysR family transcriptional regulator, partial [Klebsiella pneumoniae]